MAQIFFFTDVRGIFGNFSTKYILKIQTGFDALFYFNKINKYTLYFIESTHFSEHYTGTGYCLTLATMDFESSQISNNQLDNQLQT